MTERRLVTVVDLDETLVHSRPRDAVTERPDFWWAGFGVWIRPGAREFLLERAAHGVVGIWTASDPDYALPILERLLRGDLSPLSFVLTSRSCRLDATGEPIKPLTELADRWEPSRTVALDNRPSTFALNPDQGICVPDFLGDPEDRVLTELSAYLRTLDLPTVDVRCLDHRHWRG